MRTEASYDVTTHEILTAIYEYMCDGRIYLAREKLEELLKIQMEN
jgi:hypothetical protein